MRPKQLGRLRVEGPELLDTGHRRVVRLLLLELEPRRIAIYHRLPLIVSVACLRARGQDGRSVHGLRGSPCVASMGSHDLLASPSLPFQLFVSLDALFQTQFGFLQWALAQPLKQVLSHRHQVLLSNQVVVDLVLKSRVWT